MAVLGLLGLLVWAGVPRWEQHVHAGAGYDHRHTGHVGTAADHHRLHGSADADATESAPTAAEDARSAHLHELPSPPATAAALLRLALPAIAPAGWDAPLTAAKADYRAWPPPYRPPIA